MTLNPPLYGADVPGSLFDPDSKVGGASAAHPLWMGLGWHAVHAMAWPHMA